MLDHTQCISLLPLRLEIRQVRTTFSPVSPVRMPRRPPSRIPPASSPTQEYWIRWYPDDLSLLSPAKVISDEEDAAYKEFMKFCNRQETSFRRVDGAYIEYIGQLAEYTKNLVQGLGGVEKKAEEILEIYNGLRDGILTPDQKQVCALYNQKTLNILLELYEDQKSRPPETRFVGLRLGWKKIYDLDNPAIGWAWNLFAEKVGIVRARYIITASLNPDFLPPTDVNPTQTVLNKGVKVTLMPPWIQLFALISDGASERVEPLGDPIRIDIEYLRVGFQKGDETDWLTNFDVALRKGMGVKIQNRDHVDLVKKADWLFAVGFDERTQFEDGTPSKRFQDILMALRSRGELALIPQDTPTNNSESKNSGYTDNPTDLKAYIRESLRSQLKDPNFNPTKLVRPVLFTSTGDASLLSSALQMHPSVFSEIPGGDLEEQSEAEAMGLLLWRACTHATEWFFGASSVRWDSLEKIFAKFIRARGPLPILGIGKNPYGILPIMDISEWKVDGRWLSVEDQATLQQIKNISQFLQQEMQDLTKSVPSLGNVPGEKHYETLLEILRLHAVSKEVFQRSLLKREGQWDINENSDYILGPLVRDLGEESEETIPYLEAIAKGQYIISPDYEEQLNYVFTGNDRADAIRFLRKRVEYHAPNGEISALEPPEFIRLFENNKSQLRVKYSLLHKLLSLYIYSVPEEIDQRLSNVKAAAQTLMSLPVSKLEALMMENLDLLTFRIDAWVTAIATLRMYECSLNPSPQGMAYGAYGWLEKPGKILADENASEYLQAPSLAQAASGALLRSGALSQAEEGGDSPYQIHLDSQRTAKGMWFLDQLRNGYPAGEILGYRLERMIHQIAANSTGNNTLDDSDIFKLRDLFRLPHQTNTEGSNQQQQPETAYASLIDGKKFIDSFSKIESDAVLSPKRTELEALKNTLQDITDSAADIAVSEMVYQFMKGNTARAGAWMDFAEGEILPPEVEFVQTPRTGNIRKTYLYLSLSDQSDATGLESPVSTIFDPVLDNFCVSFLPDWANQTVMVNIKRDKLEASCSFALQNPQAPFSLNISPANYIWGGEEELFYRIRQAVIYHWKQGAFPELGRFPKEAENDPFLHQLELKINPESTTPYLKKADALKRCLKRSQKENSLSPFENPLPLAFQFGALQQREIQLDWTSTTARFQTRQTLLNQYLDELIGQLEALLTSEGESLSDEKKADLLAVYASPFSPESLPQQLAQIGVLEGLKIPSVADTQESLQQIELTLKNIHTELTRRKEIVQRKVTVLASLNGEEKVKALVEILAILIGKAQAEPLLPLYRKNSSWIAYFNYTSLPADMQSSLFQREIPVDTRENFDLTKYAAIHPAVRDITNVLSQYPSHFHGFSVLNEVYYSTQSSFTGSSLIFLPLYQWDEVLPNSSEGTALAVRYSTPKTQAPNAVLIATPPQINSTLFWSAQLVANALAATLKLMKLRMISADQIIGHKNLSKYLPLCFPYDGEGFFRISQRFLSPNVIADSYHLKVLEENEAFMSPPTVTVGRED